MPIEWYDINNKKNSSYSKKAELEFSLGISLIKRKRGNCGCLTGTLNF